MYYVIYGLMYVFSLLPRPVLYLFSDLAYVLLYYITGYRRKVVKANLLQAFPEKTVKERKLIEKKFYHNFADSFAETIKLLSASKKFIRKRFYGDFSLVSQYYEQGKKCQLVLGHHFNWEYANLSLQLNIPQLVLTVYMPIENRIFDRLQKKLRSRTGAVPLPATNIGPALIPYRNSLYALVLVADQNPGHPKNAQWVNFFGKPAPFVKAPESGARRGNTPVIYSHFVKEKRGHYRVLFKVATDNPASFKRGELTLQYVRYLEEAIRAYPDLWLWSHRRWKWEWKPEYGKVIE